MEAQEININKIVQNKGQIIGLPSNPRQWTKADVERLAASIEETPELLDARPLIALQQDDRFVVLGGNLRLAALKHLGRKTAPVYVIPEDTPIEKQKEIVIKDNGAFGAWDFDMLANEWDDLPLTDWGVPTWDTKEEVSPDDYGTDFNLPDGDKTPFRQISFQLSNEMADVLLYAMDTAKYTDGFYEIEGDEEDKNANGVAIYIMAKAWLEQLSEEFKDGDYEEAKKEVEGLRLYLRNALQQSGRKAVDVDNLLGTSGMSGHYFGSSQWMFPTKAAYEKMKEIMPLPRDFSDCKKIELRFRLIDMIRKK